MSKQKSVIPVLWIMLFDHTCLNMTFPILTLLFFDTASRLFSPDTSHAVRSMWYGVCVSIPHIMNILVTPILSSLSDIYGRKKILLIGTLGAFLFTVTAACGIFFGMLNLVLLGRVIQGAFSRTNPIAQAIIGDISTKEKKVLYMGYLQCAISLGAFIGPVFGGYIANRLWFAELNFSLPYWVAGVFAAISFLLTVLFFQETLHQPKIKQECRLFDYLTIKKLLLRPAVLLTSMIVLLSQISWSLYYQFMPPILKTVLQFDAHQLGLFVGLIAFWLALATGVGIRLLHWFVNLRQMLIFSLYLVLLGSVMSALCCYLPGASWLIWVAAIPTAVGDVIAYSCLITVYSNLVEKEQQGKIMGICFIIVAIVWALAGMLGGVMMSMYALLPLLVAPIGILLAMVLVHRSENDVFLPP